MKKLVFSILLVMQVFLGMAQNPGKITGKVVDSKTQRPLQSVIVTVQNTTLMRLTSSDGVFLLEDVPAGNQLLELKSDGYSRQLLNIEVEENQLLDLGIIVFEEDMRVEQQLSLITLTENDLGDDNSGSENTSGLLQASRDVFLQTAAFNLGQARFRVRGLDNEYGSTMINGVMMNKLYDGRPQWGNWGGLNDATRNQEFTNGSAPVDYTFGGVLGTQTINTRASVFRKGTRISFSGANTNYNWRSMVTHASGMNQKGWAFVVSASGRWANEAQFEGTDYDAKSLFASVEKRFNENHSLNFTSIYAQNSRGKNSPNTEEANNIAGINYNSYWGWQDGKKRNSRDKDLEEPILILSHYWKLTNRSKLQTNVSYQTGKIGNSRLDFYKADNPDPTYYRNLPSYFTTLHTNGVWTPDFEAAQNARFLTDRQVNWDAMYQANTNNVLEPGRSVYVLYEDRTDDKMFTANTIFNSSVADNIIMNAGVNYRKLKSENFQNVLDLLGGEYFLDYDPFFLGSEQQADLRNPDRSVGVGDRYGYNYILHADVVDAFTQFKFTYDKFDFYLAQNYTRTQYQREGLYQNGIYPESSLGKGAKAIFENFGFKGGFTYKLTGRHLFDFNAIYMTKAPTMRNTFPNARLNNAITNDLKSETISSVDASYIIRAPKFKSRLTGYYSKIQDATEIGFFFAEGLGVVGSGSEGNRFVAEIVNGLDKQNLGLEFGAEYQISQTIKLNGVIGYGQHIYTNNPNVSLNIDNLKGVFDLGEAKLKNYKQSGMPQTAASLGIEYRNPRFWWIGANANYLDDNYLDIAALMRTDNFVLDPDSPIGLSLPDASEENVRKYLKQEQFESVVLVNLVGGKSWRINNKTFGFFASLNNVFDQRYKTGGFEQGRNASFTEVDRDHQGPARSFGPRYFYGFGRNYFLNLYVNF
ncbi:MAG: TonB-dependent receptor [Bacteroidetes bacterium HGW-Bacteroidetes-23]|nr:MAG: TonB-dependent receptor [Bacteroidetes bacterium HGW-Bacteroidetes-23]